MEYIKWMYWTWPTASFFLGIIAMLCGLTVWDEYDPGYARKGILPIQTTRGDRVFMGLLAIGFVFLFWLRFFTDVTAWAFVIASAIVFLVILIWF